MIRNMGIDTRIHTGFLSRCEWSTDRPAAILLYEVLCTRKGIREKELVIHRHNLTL